MSYQEKRTIASFLVALIVLGTYCFYAFHRYRAGLIARDDIRSWAIMILIFVGIAIAAGIVSQILFHILLSISVAARQHIEHGKCDDKEIGRAIECEMVTDEMDKLIELKSMWIAFAIAGVGFLAALVSQVAGYSPAFMLNTMYISFFIGSLVQHGVQLYFYRRGV